MQKRRAAVIAALGVLSVVLWWRALDARGHVATWDTGWAASVVRQACTPYHDTSDGFDGHFCADSMSECEAFRARASDHAEFSDVGSCRFVSNAPGDLRDYRIMLFCSIAITLAFAGATAQPAMKRMAASRDDAWRRRNM